MDTMRMEILYFIIYIISTVISCIICAAIADSKSLNVGVWIAAGIFLGCIAVIIVALMPEGHDETIPRGPSNPYAHTKSYFNKNAKVACPNCGSYATGNETVCDMCGCKLNRPLLHANSTQKSSSSVVRTTSSTKKTIPIPKVEKYRCSGCNELIDTIQCPWCGRKKNW